MVPWSFSLSDLSTPGFWHFIGYSSGFPTLALAPAEVCTLVSCDSLYSLVGLFNLGDSGLPCDQTSLMDLRGVVQFVQLLLIMRIEW